MLVFVAATFAGSGLWLALIKLQSFAGLALAVAIVMAAVAALASEWAQRLLDNVPEYDGLIADLRKMVNPKWSGAPPGAVLSVGDVARIPVEGLSPEAIKALTRVVKAASPGASIYVGDDDVVGRRVYVAAPEAALPHATGVRVASDGDRGDTPPNEAEAETKASSDTRNRGRR